MLKNNNVLPRDRWSLFSCCEPGADDQPNIQDFPAGTADSSKLVTFSLFCSKLIIILLNRIIYLKVIETGV
jgi:hypothetical protein